jgi:hypothetical protein
MARNVVSSVAVRKTPDPVRAGARGRRAARNAAGATTAINAPTPSPRTTSRRPTPGGIPGTICTISAPGVNVFLPAGDASSQDRPTPALQLVAKGQRRQDRARERRTLEVAAAHVRNREASLDTTFRSF